MASAVVPFALLVAVLNAAAAILGAWTWWRGGVSRWFWWAARGGQIAAVLFAALCGVAFLAGDEPGDDLFWLYALLPLAVGLVGEQLRILSARTELDVRELEDAQAMRALADAEQRAIVVAILRREMAVMACAAGVVAFLALRAASTW
jgi:hypothetical protein